MNRKYSGLNCEMCNRIYYQLEATSFFLFLFTWVLTALESCLFKTIAWNLSKSVRFLLLFYFTIFFPNPVLLNLLTKSNFSIYFLRSPVLVFISTPTNLNLTTESLRLEITYLVTPNPGPSITTFNPFTKSTTTAIRPANGP